ncbi:ferredoxin family protein [Acidithiobacillus caldus]|uniref:Ferredoxin n=1 Tax=Acidithiobacillus caldus TaxID=33059 RepID=B1A4J2_9PROT|nr:ferredoxin FdxA [Acidithiobacillus caldus]ACA00170.1 ferredoxin-like protein [Acidithiobacillus caldus]MBU2819831.1 ferredoxin family protein [Acidithiobacillus caldus]
MTYVVTDNCVNCKYMDCVDVCPVDCFHEGKNFLVIDPSVCIDCGVCEPECPASAIYKDSDLPDEFVAYLDINKKLSSSWPLIKYKKDELPEAHKWDGIPNKRSYIEA